VACLAPSGGLAPSETLAPGRLAPYGGLAPSETLAPSSCTPAPPVITGGSSGGWRVTTDPYQYSIVDDTITVYEVEDEEALLVLLASL